jgi:pantoate--beta-alanine ligase
MLIAKTIKELNQILQKNQEKSLGFVPTMGALHQGHVSLIERAVNENEFVVVSIFVNPKQFDNSNDLENYPMDLSGDIQKIEGIADCLFCPEINEIYPSDYEELKFEIDQLEQVMEGQHRQGHFQGVCNIVYLLFDLIHPNKAYFGIKDYQQLAIVKHIAKIHFPSINIVPCDIIREDNGLAKSSRNLNLNQNDFQKASIIYRTLTEAKNLFHINKSIDQIKEIVKGEFQKEEIELEYFEISDPETLQPVDKPIPKSRGFIAAYVGNVRLIDNLELIE